MRKRLDDLLSFSYTCTQLFGPVHSHPLSVPSFLDIKRVFTCRSVVVSIRFWVGFSLHEYRRGRALRRLFFFCSLHYCSSHSSLAFCSHTKAKNARCAC